MRSCVAIVNYHPPHHSYTIPGVAVRLGQVLQMLDEHGIDHYPIEVIRKELKSCRLAVPSTKQYFLCEEYIGKKMMGPLQRSQQRCRGCAVIPHSSVPMEFFDTFPTRKAALLYFVLMHQTLCLCSRSPFTSKA